MESSSLLVRVLATAALLGGAGCGSSHPSEPDDAAIVFDALPPDAGTDSARPVDARVARCGDSILDPMEGCDDGNLESGDGCSDMCRREAYCGNGMLETTEVCDDGNNHSGDGCRSDCLSTEECGNGIRDVVVGETCDDGNVIDGDGCSATCRLEGCGNGELVPPEECDDGNETPWDGCALDCTYERSMVLSALQIGAPAVGCDYTGDGNADNALSRAFGGSLGLINPMLMNAISDGSITLLLSYLGLDDPSGATDPSLRVAWAQGEDADGDVSNNFSGSGEFYGTMDGFAADGSPLTSFESRLSAHMLSGGPEDLEIPLGFFLPLELKQGRIHGTTTEMSGELYGIDDGLICGAVPIGTLALLPNPLGMIPGGGDAPACDGTADSGSLADILVGGAMPIGIRIGPATPDVDLDGDGLEAFEVQSDGPPDCQPVVVACIDGDGTRIEGRNCMLDPRIADGFSAGLPFTAVRARIVGIR